MEQATAIYEAFNCPTLRPPARFNCPLMSYPVLCNGTATTSLFLVYTLSYYMLILALVLVLLHVGATRLQYISELAYLTSCS